MKIYLKAVLLLYVSLCTFCCTPSTGQTPAQGSRISQSFNHGWSFQLGNEEGKLEPANWREVHLPHDWSIESEYDTIHGTDWQSGFLEAGIGWYQKDFTYDPTWKNRKVIIHFEGVYLNSTVWLNDQLLGHRPNGYLDFYYDLSSHLKEGTNTIKVKVDHSKPLSGRWYTGSGIYRNVWLYSLNPTHIDIWGTYFRTNNLTKDEVDIYTDVSILNEEEVEKKLKVSCKLIDSEGRKVLEFGNRVSLAPGSEQVIQLTGKLSNPKLWSPETPNLYTLRTELVEGGKTIDEQEIQVGIREFEFRGDSGLYVNGVNTLVKGVCLHHAAGPVGSAIPYDVLERRLKLLKEMGTNAIRTSHNPYSPDFYTLCNELGFLVMDEFTDGWEKAKAADDYGNYWEEWWKIDAETFLTRDRNHPSIFMWSIGNEVKKPTRQTQKELIDFFKTYDQTRPITQGGHDPTRGMKGDKLPTQLDVKGFNGDGEEKDVFEKYHAQYPNSPMIGTEVPHTYQTRGVYRTKTHWRRRDFPAMWEIKSGNAGTLRGIEGKVFDLPDLTEEEVFLEEKSTHYYKDGEFIPIASDAPWKENLYYQSSYDNATVRSSARKAWQRVEEFPYVMGQFRWTAFDYLGETNNWPSRFGNFGIIDLCGFPKDHFYLYQSLWTETPMVHLLPHWTHPGKEGVDIPVVVYTNCEEAELFLNGESLGKKAYEGDQLVWMVPYTAGEIKVVSYNDGKTVAEKSYQTSGVATKIDLQLDKKTIHANRRDVIHVETSVLDEKGIFYPYADQVIHFEVEGPGSIIGVENGDPLDLSSYKTNQRKAFRGKCLLMVQATEETGSIKITAKADGLESETVVVQVE